MKTGQGEKRIPMPSPLLEVVTGSGRKIMAVQIHVGFTYGTYTKVFESKERIGEMNLELLWGEYPAKVLWQRDFPSVVLRRYEYQSPERSALPVYKVTALFESTPLNRKNSRHSALVVSWFQDHTRPLLSSENRKALRDLDWEGLAKDFN